MGPGGGLQLGRTLIVGWVEGLVLLGGVGPFGGGGANTKVPDMYGVGGVFGTQNTKVTCTLLYNKGGVSIFYPESQKYKWYFCTHIS